MADSPQSNAITSKGKQRVSFAPDADLEDASRVASERTPLLSSPPIDTSGDEDDEEAKDQVGTLPLSSRIHKNIKKGWQAGHAKVKQVGRATFPSYRRRNGEDYEDDGDTTTKRILLYSILGLVIIAVLLGGAVIVQSSEGRKHGTGPYPRPPKPSLPDQTASGALIPQPTPNGFAGA